VGHMLNHLYLPVNSILLTCNVVSMSLNFLYPPKVLGGLQSLNSYGVPRFRVHVVVTYMVKVARTTRESIALGSQV
jgi:hypothetical protein